MLKKKSIFSIKLVRNIFFVMLLKIIGFVILFILFFSPSHRVKVTPSSVFEEVFSGDTDKDKQNIDK